MANKSSNCGPISHVHHIITSIHVCVRILTDTVWHISPKIIIAEVLPITTFIDQWFVLIVEHVASVTVHLHLGSIINLLSAILGGTQGPWLAFAS